MIERPSTHPWVAAGRECVRFAIVGVFLRERKLDGIRIPDAHLRTQSLFATPAEAIAHYQMLADAGMQYFLAVVNGYDTETVHLLAEEDMPAIRLGSGG